MKTTAGKRMCATNLVNLNEDFITFCQSNSYHLCSFQVVIVVRIQEQVSNGTSFPSELQMNTMVAGRRRNCNDHGEHVTAIYWRSENASDMTIRIPNISNDVIKYHDVTNARTVQ